MSGYFEGAIKLAVMLAALMYPRLGDLSDGIFLPILAGTLVCTLFYVISLLAPLIDMKTDKKYI